MARSAVAPANWFPSENSDGLIEAHLEAVPVAHQDLAFPSENSDGLIEAFATRR